MTDLWGVSSYRVCDGLLGQLCGEAEDRPPSYFSLARLALDWGAARVSEIPAELLASDARSQRIEWLERRLEEWLGDEHRELFENLTKLRDADDAMERARNEMEEQALTALIQSHATEGDRP